MIFLYIYKKERSSKILNLSWYNFTFVDLQTYVWNAETTLYESYKHS